MNRLLLKSPAERRAAAGAAAIIGCCMIAPLLVGSVALGMLGEFLVIGVALLPLTVVLWRKRPPHTKREESVAAAEGDACDLGPNGACATGDRRRGILSGGCCSDAVGLDADAGMGPRARYARLLAGFIFLVIAGAMASRQLPGDIALWPAALVPTWFGVAHLVAAMTGYRGCPELGAIPSVILDRRVGTTCLSWERIDRRLEPDGVPQAVCCG